MEVYGFDTLKNLYERELRTRAKGNLDNHEINPMVRAKMVDWMVEVLSLFGLSQDTFMLAVHIMDNYLGKTNRVL